MLSWIKVTSPVPANSRPAIDTLSLTVIDVAAKMVPTKVLPLPRVADPAVDGLPTVQKTLHAIWAAVRSLGSPLARNITTLPEAVTRLEEAWKIQTAPELPWASSVSVFWMLAVGSAPKL